MMRRVRRQHQEPAVQQHQPGKKEQEVAGQQGQ
jgi:hypothetical protein